MPVRVLCWTRKVVFLEPRWNMDVQKVLWSGRLAKFSGLLLRKNMRGTNVARLRISVWFVGHFEVGGHPRSEDSTDGLLVTR